MVTFIDFPIYDGVSGGLVPWILWLEDFFVREKFTTLEKMNLAQSLLEGEAEEWFYTIQKSLIFYSWKELKNKLLLRFGDFADPELFRLWDKNYRILRKRRKRMKATSIQEKVTIWDTETEALVPMDTIPVMNLTESRDSISATKLIQEANSAPVMDGGVSLEKEISCQAVEYIHTIELFYAKESMEKAESSSAKDESITQTQVPVSSLEPGLRFSSEIIDVSVAWPSEMVSHNRVHSQAGCECVKNTNNAHQVFDELFLRRHHVLHDPGGKTDEHSDDIVETEVDIDNVQRPQVDTVAESVITTPENVVELVITAPDNVAESVITVPSIVASSSNDVAPSTDVITKRQRWDEDCDAEIDVLDGLKTVRIFTSTPVASVTSLSFEVDHFELCVGHDRDIMRLKLLLHSGCDGAKLTELDFHFGENHGLLVVPWNLMLLAFFLFFHLEDKVCLSGASNSGCGWLVFDRGKNNMISGNVITLVFWDLKKCFFQRAEKRDVQKMLLGKANDAHVDSLMCGDVTFFLKHKWRFKYKGRLKTIKLTNTMFLWEKVHMVSCLSLDAQFHSLEFQLKHKWRSKHLYTMSALEFQVVERIGVVVFKDQPLPREIAAELDSFAPVFVIVILVVVDRLSKAVHVLGLKHPFKPGWRIGFHQQGVLD